MASVGEAGRSVWAGGLTGAWGTEGLCTEVLAPQLPHQTKQGLSLPLPPEFSPSGDSSRGLASPVPALPLGLSGSPWSGGPGAALLSEESPCWAPPLRPACLPPRRPPSSPF